MRISLSQNELTKIYACLKYISGRDKRHSENPISKFTQEQDDELNLDGIACKISLYIDNSKMIDQIDDVISEYVKGNPAIDYDHEDEE